MTSTSDSRVAAVKDAITDFLDSWGWTLTNDSLDDVALQLTDSHEHDYDSPNEISAPEFANAAVNLWHLGPLRPTFTLSTVEHVETFTHAEHGIDATVTYKWKGSHVDHHWPFLTYYNNGEWSIQVRPSNYAVNGRIRNCLVDRGDLVTENGDFHIAISVNQPAGEHDPSTVDVRTLLIGDAMGEVVISYQEQAAAA